MDGMIKKFTNGDLEMGEQYEHEHKLDGKIWLLDIFLCVIDCPKSLAWTEFLGSMWAFVLESEIQYF